MRPVGNSTASVVNPWTETTQLRTNLLDEAAKGVTGQNGSSLPPRG
jgi:hypothetical protein